MVRMLLAATAVAAFAIPAASAGAEHMVSPQMTHGKPQPFRGFDRRSGRRGDEGAAIWSGYALQSSYDDSDWRADGGNDWWNEHPERAYPRWVQDQHATGTCQPDRMWWSGSGWHC